MTDHARGFGRHEIVALGDAELGVGVVGLREALHHRLGTGHAENLALCVGGAFRGLRRRRPIHVERHFAPAEPALRGDLAEIADMV